VMAKGVSFEDYAHCLLKNMSVEQITGNPTSPLSSNSNKKRIVMMTKEKTSGYKFILYLLLIPASTILLMSFGKTENRLQADVQRVAPTSGVENIPDIAPVDFTKVKSVVLYGKRVNPAPGQMENHTGIDFELPEGSDVVATADGVVIHARYDEKWGNHVLISHGDIYGSRYSHLAAAIVKQGDKIIKGQVIGHIGNSGLSKAPHLHYEILKNGTKVDPKNYLPKLPGS
jgi:murein DD-endopeptidase MepM/ murein hydrolase activator NlpD